LVLSAAALLNLFSISCSKHLQGKSSPPAGCWLLAAGTHCCGLYGAGAWSQPALLLAARCSLLSILNLADSKKLLFAGPALRRDTRIPSSTCFRTTPHLQRV
jgi:hypothetical protein